MQLKIIKKVIITKLNEWLETITDQSLRSEIKNSILVSGGAITSMLLNLPVNDFDIYFTNRDVLKRLIEYYIRDIQGIQILDGHNKQELVDKIEEDYKDIHPRKTINDIFSTRGSSIRNLQPEQLKLFFEDKQGGMKVNTHIEKDKLNYTPLFLSANAISLSNQIQIVIRFHGTVEEIHKTFDFIHATNYFTFNDGLVTNKSALESLLTKQLKYQGSLYSVTSIIRAKKFVKRNWNIGAGELLKIMFQISQLNLADPDILEEQLIGIDVAYFTLLIDALREKQKDKDFKITSEYLNAIIDKIFNESTGEDDDISTAPTNEIINS